MTEPDQAISIALCTYNGAGFLDEQMRSLRVQQKVFEIVAVDDASTDDTWEILQAHAREDARIRLFRNGATLGVTRNFEQAIRLVRGPWVALADQDDVWLPGKIAQMSAAWDGQACLLHHATRKFHWLPPETVPSPAGERRKFSGSDVRRLLYRNTIVGHTILARTEMIRRLMPFPAGVPHDWWIGAGASLRGRVQYVDEFLVHYRIHRHNAYHSSSSRIHRLRIEHQLRVRLLEALIAETALPEEARKFAAEYLRLLQAARVRWFSWPLCRFYLRQAGTLFGVGSARCRKCVAATFGAMAQVPLRAGTEGVVIPAVRLEPVAAERLRQSA